MSTLPIGIGDREAQQRFIDRHEAFLREYRYLNDLTKRIFQRTLEDPDQREVERLLLLPEEAPEVTAFENRMAADRVVFYLGRVAVEDFVEIVVLSGNGLGFGAYKILRGMYERVVTAMYIAKHPAEARVFVESSAIMKRNYLKPGFPI